MEYINMRLKADE